MHQKNKIPALIIDGRCWYDQAWWSSRKMEEAEISSKKAAATVSLSILAGLLGPGGKLPFAPENILICWDGDSAKTDKPREDKPVDHAPDLAYFKKMLPVLIGGASYQMPSGVVGESDDAVATALDLYADKYDFCIVSTDKDLQQLIGETRYYCLGRKIEIKRQHLVEKWGVSRPSHVALYLSLVGDDIDGINGVDQIGPVTAKKLLAKTGDVPLREAIDAVSADLNEIELDQLYAALELTVLRRDMPGVPEPAPIKIAPMSDLTKFGIFSDGRKAWSNLIRRSLYDS